MKMVENSMERNLSSLARNVVQHAKIPHHIPHQKNGVVERMNMILIDKARSILGGSGLAQEFWVTQKNVW
jgi:hypothetical protein